MSAAEHESLSDGDGASLDNEPLTDAERESATLTARAYPNIKGAVRLRLVHGAESSARSRKSRGLEDRPPPYRRHYSIDFLADTLGYSIHEAWAATFLSDIFWRDGSLPSDDGQVRELCRMTPVQWAKSRAKIAKFFDDGWRNDALSEERDTTMRNIRARRAGGSLGGLKSAANRRGRDEDEG